MSDVAPAAVDTSGMTPAQIAKEERRRQFQSQGVPVKAKPTKDERRAQQQKSGKQQKAAAAATATTTAAASVQPSKKGRGGGSGGGSQFAHLPAYIAHTSSSLGIRMGAPSPIHPSFIAMGLSISKQALTEWKRARTVSMLTCIKLLLRDFDCPQGDVFSRQFESILKLQLAFIEKIRPLSVSMKNAAVAFSSALSQLDPSITSDLAKRELCNMIERFIEERIVFAGNAIIKLAEEKIEKDDVILTFSKYSLIEEIIINAYNQGIPFRIIVADSSPQFHGRQSLNRLTRLCPNLNCSYVMISSVTYVMKEVTKVFIGATSMLANGAAQARIGSAVIALMADTYHVPFIVCCETRKFSEMAQVDAITFNEVGNTSLLVQPIAGEGDSPLQDFKAIDNLSLLYLRYDITPARFISMLITEVGMIPASSVPAVTREFLSL